MECNNYSDHLTHISFLPVKVQLCSGVRVGILGHEPITLCQPVRQRNQPMSQRKVVSDLAKRERLKGNCSYIASAFLPYMCHEDTTLELGELFYAHKNHGRPER